MARRASQRRGSRAVLVAAGVVYLLPLVVGVLLHVAHGAEHALAWSTEFARATPSAFVVHSHDGTTHSHGRAVTLLASAVQEDESSDAEADPDAIPPLVFLAVLTSERPLAEPLRHLVGDPEVPATDGSPDPATPLLPPPQG